MSFSLYWRPADPPPPPETPEDNQLKYKLAPLLFEHDGTLRSGPVVLTSSNGIVIGYLKGLAACEVDGAQDLLDAINDHGGVVLWVGDSDDH